MSNKNTTPKNKNKEVICAFLTTEGTMQLSYLDAFKKFFDIKENSIIRPDAFRFYHKKVKAGEIDLNKLDEAKTESEKPAVEVKKEVEPPAKNDLLLNAEETIEKALAAKPAEEAVKKAVAKPKVVTAQKI